MGRPIIVVRENGLVLEVDLDQRCGPPQVSPSSGPSRTYTIRWADATLDDGDWAPKRRGKKHWELRLGKPETRAAGKAAGEKRPKSSKKASRKS